jgi:tellurite resistance protein
VSRYLQDFLTERYFIQINRDKTGLFQWQVIVGQQGLTSPGATSDHARAENDDLLDAVFDACVEAARMDKRHSMPETG